MQTPTRLLFGVRTTGTVSLTITASGQLPPEVPDLRICTSGKDIAIPCSNNGWIATLEAGDHVVHLPATSDKSLDGPLTIALGAPATLVAWETPDSALLVSWTFAIGASSDPKNPWPPPVSASPAATALAESTWLIDTLTTQRTKVLVERSA